MANFSTLVFNLTTLTGCPEVCLCAFATRSFTQTLHKTERVLLGIGSVCFRLPHYSTKHDYNDKHLRRVSPRALYNHSSKRGHSRSWVLRTGPARRSLSLWHSMPILFSSRISHLPPSLLYPFLCFLMSTFSVVFVTLCVLFFVLLVPLFFFFGCRRGYTEHTDDESSLLDTHPTRRQSPSDAQLENPQWPVPRYVAASTFGKLLAQSLKSQTYVICSYSVGPLIITFPHHPPCWGFCMPDASVGMVDRMRMLRLQRDKLAESL